MTLSIRNLDAPLGTEVSGIDLSKPVALGDRWLQARCHAYHARIAALPVPYARIPAPSRASHWVSQSIPSFPRTKHDGLYPTVAGIRQFSV